MSRTNSVKSATHIQKPLSRQSSVRVQTPINKPIAEKILSFSTTEILSELEANSTLTVSNVQATILPNSSTSSTLQELPKKHVDLSTEPVIIKPTAATGSNGWGRYDRESIIN